MVAVPERKKPAKVIGGKPLKTDGRINEVTTFGIELRTCLRIWIIGRRIVVSHNLIAIAIFQRNLVSRL